MGKGSSRQVTSNEDNNVTSNEDNNVARVERLARESRTRRQNARRVIAQDEDTRIANVRRLARDRRARSQNSSVVSVPDGRLDYTASGFIYDINNNFRLWLFDTDWSNKRWMHEWTRTEQRIVLSFYLAVFVRYELDKVNNEFHEMIRYILDDVLSKGHKHYQKLTDNRKEDWNAGGIRSMISDLLYLTKEIEGVDSNEFKQEISKTKEDVETLLVKYQWCYKEPTPDAEEEIDDSEEVDYPDRPKCTPIIAKGPWLDLRYYKKRSYLINYESFSALMKDDEDDDWKGYLWGLMRGRAMPLDSDVGVNTLKF